MGRTFTNLHMRRAETKNAGTLCGGSDSPLWAISLRSVGPGNIKELLADPHPCRRCVKVFNAEDPAPKNRLGAEKAGPGKTTTTKKKTTRTKKTKKTKKTTAKKATAKKSAKPAASKPKPTKTKTKTKSAKAAKPSKKLAAKSKLKVRPRTTRERVKPKTLLALDTSMDTSIPVAGIDIATSATSAAAA